MTNAVPLLVSKTGLTIGHRPGEAHGRPHVTKGRFAIQAIFATSAGGTPDGDDMITRLDAGDAGADFLHDARPFVTQDDGAGHGQISLDHMQVTVTDARRLHADGDFTRLLR